MRNVRPALLLAMAVAVAPTGTKDAVLETLSKQLVVFTLVRGGSSESDYESFVNSRRCLDQVMPHTVAYDHVAFHEGNVPLAVQRALNDNM
jgi:hypothetical protein